jgi:hypothetical protein
MNEVKKTGMQNGSQMRITPDEIAAIKRTFKDNEPLLLLMRKMFLPEIDPKAPIGQLVDLWLTLKIEDLSPEDVVIKLRARNEVIAHVDQVLMQLKLISMMEEQTKEEVVASVQKNSAK